MVCSTSIVAVWVYWHCPGVRGRAVPMVTLRHSAAGHWTHSILAASRGGYSETIIQYTLFENKVFVVMLEAIARQGQGARFKNISDIFFKRLLSWENFMCVEVRCDLEEFLDNVKRFIENRMKMLQYIPLQHLAPVAGLNIKYRRGETEIQSHRRQSPWSRWLHYCHGGGGTALHPGVRGWLSWQSGDRELSADICRVSLLRYCQ